MSINENSIVELRLSVQKDGEEYTIGDKGLSTFIRVPEEAAILVGLCDGINSVREVAVSLKNTYQYDVDVIDFLGELAELGLVYSVDGEILKESESKQPSEIKVSRLANILFSPLLVIVYSVLFLISIALFILFPDLLPAYDESMVSPYTGVNLLLFFVITWTLTVFHEYGHYLAAIRLGIPVRFQLNLRLVWLVVEADMTGLWSMEKNKRFVPYLAGIMFDTCVLFTILVFQLLLPGTLSELASLITFCMILQFSMHFLIFLRTDLYFILINALHIGNLHEAANSYLKNIVNRKKVIELFKDWPSREYRYIKMFSFLQICGYLFAAFLLFNFILPNAYSMVTFIYDQLMYNDVYSMAFLDGLLLVGVLFASMLLWFIGAFNKYKETKRLVKMDN